ncbi:MAG: hypothetical protein GX629_11105 [Phycisphaerae bacterium]|jgi:hypothetical protein|nr:hypothetical protein [Phycisphaerae bacterium]
MWQVGAVLIRTGPRTHKEATELVLEQAKVLCQDWAGSHFAREKQSALRFFLGKRQDKSKNPMGPVGLEPTTR